MIWHRLPATRRGEPPGCSIAIGVLPSAPGRRSQGCPGHRDRAALYEAGLLAVEEKAVLEVEWRQDFERGCDPGFSLSVGPDEHLTGAAARRALHRWAGIPRELVRSGRLSASVRLGRSASSKQPRRPGEGKPAQRDAGKVGATTGGGSARRSSKIARRC
jgi:hypothetical protein